jgi:4-diphosphocytidyl-2-C-methyl-D-erythritol kinase
LPLFLIGGTVLGAGRGEEVYPLPDLPAIACVIALPEIAVSTPRAFADWDRLCGAGNPSTSSGQALAREGDGISQQNPRNTRAAVEKLDLAEQSSAWTGEGARPHMGIASAVQQQVAEQQVPRLRRSFASERSSSLGMTQFGRKKEPRAGSKLTSPSHSDRMLEFSCETSAWLSAAPVGSGRRRSGVSTKGGGRAENLLLDLVRTGIENDFEKVVFPQYPELHEVKCVLEAAGARYASLSGSGSAVYGLFNSREKAAAAARKLDREGTRAVVTSTLSRRQYWKQLFSH